MWRSHSLKTRNSGGLSSIVLDASQGIPHQKSLKDNCFVYRFVQDTSCLSDVSDGDPSSAALKSDLDLTLKSGDHVVWIISFYSFSFK